MTLVAQRAARMPISLVEGADFSIGLAITENGVAYPWAGATVVASILDLDDSPAAVTAWTFTPGVSGAAIMSLTDAQTTTLGVGTFRYSVEVTKAGITTPWLGGQLSILDSWNGGPSNSTATFSILTAPTVTLGIEAFGWGSGVLTVDGNLLTRAAGAPAEITRANLAADAAFTSRYVPRPASTEKTIYVSAGALGNDANDGLTWGLAKATIAAAKTALAGTAGTIQLGAGTFHLLVADGSGNGLTLDQIGMKIEGMGSTRTKVVCDVNLTYGICATAAQCEVNRLELNVLATKTVTYGVGVTTAGSAEDCRFREVEVQPAGGTITNAFGISPDAHADVAGTLLYGCIAYGAVDTGFLIGDGVSGNVLNTHLFGCRATAGAYGVRGFGSGFSWHGGDVGFNTTADFYFGPSSAPSVVDGCRSETSKRLFVTAGVTGAQANVSIRATTFTANALHSDGIVGKFWMSGTLVLDNVIIRTSGAVVPTIDAQTNAGNTLAVSTRNLVMAKAVATAFTTGGGGTVNVIHDNYTQVDGADAGQLITAHYPIPSPVKVETWITGKFYGQPAQLVLAYAPPEGIITVNGVWLPPGVNLTSIGCEVTTLGTAGALIRLGVWLWTPGTLNAVLMQDAGTVDGTTTGLKTASLAIAATQTYRYLILGQVCQGAAGTRPIVRGINPVNGDGPLADSTVASFVNPGFVGYCSTAAPGALSNIAITVTTVAGRTMVIGTQS